MGKLVLGAVVGVLLAVAVGAVALGAKRRPGKPRDTPGLFVVGLGDSLSSGEGNPDVPKNGSKPAPAEEPSLRPL
jgi:hypothetical protein